MLAHGSEPNMVPAALVILGMISVLPLPLVVRLWDDRRESPSPSPCFVPSGSQNL
ncbi:hypothetical protein PF008_g16697 [Phytophthora fragariae]|uniref:Uncharacterized protein n=1 Tax=Phytophthora fragariae TaxID=53985 RepID=A0A6G0RAI8_9STRA|nr:hypothetical protein PF008_g16697 [Phytophthora fragariae]